MNSKIYFVVSGTVFFIVSILHVTRLILKWDAIIGGVFIPEWASIVALVISSYLTYTAFKLTKSL